MTLKPTKVDNIFPFHEVSKYLPFLWRWHEFRWLLLYRSFFIRFTIFIKLTILFIFMRVVIFTIPMTLPWVPMTVTSSFFEIIWTIFLRLKILSFIKRLVIFPTDIRMCRSMTLMQISIPVNLVFVLSNRVLHI